MGLRPQRVPYVRGPLPGPRRQARRDHVEDQRSIEGALTQEPPVLVESCLSTEVLLGLDESLLNHPHSLALVEGQPPEEQSRPDGVDDRTERYRSCFCGHDATPLPGIEQHYVGTLGLEPDQEVVENQRRGFDEHLVSHHAVDMFGLRGLTPGPSL